MIDNKLPTIMDRLGRVFDTKNIDKQDQMVSKIEERAEEDDELDIQHNPFKF